MPKSLADLHPELVNQWHKTENGKLKPEDVTQGSGKKVWWQCIEGHEWPASINSRTGNKKQIGRGCPDCAKKNRVEKYIRI